jgi:hypothetical protein
MPRMLLIWLLLFGMALVGADRLGLGPATPSGRIHGLDNIPAPPPSPPPADRAGVPGE